jgi:hypothetical protein
MGGKYGASKKKEWINRVVCGFQKSKQGVSKGQLPIA